jgi:hypothetical protein
MPTSITIPPYSRISPPSLITSLSPPSSPQSKSPQSSKPSKKGYLSKSAPSLSSWYPLSRYSPPNYSFVSIYSGYSKPSRKTSVPSYPSIYPYALNSPSGPSGRGAARGPYGYQLLRHSISANILSSISMGVASGAKGRVSGRAAVGSRMFATMVKSSRAPAKSKAGRGIVRSANGMFGTMVKQRGAKKK